MDDCVKGVSTDIKEHISYDSFLKTFQAACHCQLAAVRPDATWGLHTFRKTGYLFAEWANAPYAQARVAARHRTDHNSIKYSRDAATLKEIAKQNGTLMELEWKAPYVADRQQALSHNTMRSLVPDNLRDLRLWQTQGLLNLASQSRSNQPSLFVLQSLTP
ncbi:hypothetical protein BCR33DRAFT_722553 [Rhizoclosmatium globosum]|uniref:Uncharacterized protein n=1 Tax=Rhizoclosmatium globosum TaxID=329046 RepID=A0A1Y2BKR2_9FUNG|nr:hypothetical protein BCR33DRAFT_722553 [Rhizoclosmatium globosum]|eukprot:ORY35210.1 hypothetical protein BCR33DRAFT_722553 [Rhizoclosmatium globosum]